MEFMSKCGMIDLDVRTNKPKVKLYKDSNGVAKGDALCTYIKVESVTLALQVIIAEILCIVSFETPFMVSCSSKYLTVIFISF